MGAQNDGELQNDVSHVDHAADAQIKQAACEPQAGHHQVVEKVISEGDANAHVLSRVVGSVQRPQQGRMGKAVPPILRQVIDQDQQAKHGPPRPIGEDVFVFRCQPVTQFAGDENRQRLRDRQQTQEHEQFQLRVIGTGVHRRFITARNNLHAGEAEDHAEQK